MPRSASLLLLAGALAVAACGGQPATSPTPSIPAPTGQPTGTPQQPGTPATTSTPQGSAQPSAAPSLDPALSDAGVVGVATLPNDPRGGRTGTHVIIGEASAGSDCGPTFEGDEFMAVAWVDEPANGELARLTVTVPIGDVPEDAGVTQDIDARVSFDFKSESSVGTLYTGDSSGDDDGSSSIDVARAARLLAFSFEGVTWDDVAFSGQVVCLTD